MSSRIIKAEARHAEVLARLGARTFAETFVGKAYYTQEIVDGYTQRAFDPEALRLELADDKVCFFLAQIDDVYAGYAKTEDRKPEPCVKEPDALYLSRFYVVKGAQGRGLGAALMTAVYAEAVARRKSWIWLSVWEHNERAQSFYRKYGFERVGAWDWPFESGGKTYVDLDYIFLGPVPRGRP